MAEQIHFLQSRLPRDEEETRSPEEILTQLAQAVENNTISDEDRAFFERVGGKTYMALQAKKRDLQEMLALSARVDFLQDKLDERRLATLEYVPERVPSSDRRRVAIDNDEAELKGHLDAVHEKLFKVVYLLDPELLKETQALVTASYNP